MSEVSEVIEVIEVRDRKNLLMEILYWKQVLHTIAFDVAESAFSAF